MLQRDRQIRTQIHQLADAALFAMSFWLAYFIRSDPFIADWFPNNPVSLDAFDRVLRFLFALVPAAPLDHRAIPELPGTQLRREECGCFQRTARDFQNDRKGNCHIVHLLPRPHTGSTNKSHHEVNLFGSRHG